MSILSTNKCKNLKREIILGEIIRQNTHWNDDQSVLLREYSDFKI